MLETETFSEIVLTAARSLGAEISSPWFYYQIGAILALAGIAYGLATLIRSRLSLAPHTATWPAPLRLIARVLVESLGTLLFAVLAGAVRLGMVASTWPSRSYLLSIAANLAVAWLAIRLATSMIRNQFLVRLIAGSAWAIAALSILGQLKPAVRALDAVAITVGGLRLSPLLIIKATVLLAVALWIANLVGNFLETRITRSRDLTPSIQVLLSKLVRVVLVVVAVALVLGAVGIDLSALALFSGAIGVGIGFGLQKIVSNFISGIILLADKSVKPGDLVTIGDNFGRISAMNTRYISVAAGDGREFLIPNEDLVTQKVTNWTYTSKDTLVKVPFNTNYDADPRAVCQLAVEVAAKTPRVAELKPPSCILAEFTERGMRFSLTFWIADPYAGMDNVKSDVMIALWEAFKREGIRVPYPVRELRIRGGALPVETTFDDEEAH
ncbi:MAG: mechanosensitive ion channel domain-containing protein [Xanthobacteraceae bacterium]